MEFMSGKSRLNENQKEKLKEEIKFYTEILKLLSTFTFLTAGGVIGLFYKMNNPISVIFIIFGIALIVGFLSGIIHIYGTIRTLLRRMEL